MPAPMRATWTLGWSRSSARWGARRGGVGRRCIALAELDRVLAAGARFGIVVADAGYGASAEFRRGLDERGRRWAVGIPRDQKVCGAAVRLVPPAGRRARRPVPSEDPRPADEVLAELPWRRVAWRRGTKGAPAARFAAIRVRVGDGATWGNNRHLPGGEVWLEGEQRPGGARKRHLSNLPPARRRGRWRPRSRPAGSAGKRTSNSSRNSAPATSRAAPGRGRTGTRS